MRVVPSAQNAAKRRQRFVMGEQRGRKVCGAEMGAAWGDGSGAECRTGCGTEFGTEFGTECRTELEASVEWTEEPNVGLNSE